MVSDLNFGSRLALHAKLCKLKLAISIIYLKRCKFLQMTPNIGNIYIKSNLSKKQIDSYHFRVRMTIDEREITNGSHGSTTPFSLVSFPVNLHWQGPGLWPSSLREIQGALNGLEEAWIPAKSHYKTT